MIRLGVNIDHIATLREVRKSQFPDLIMASDICRVAGADQITVHLREDRRHIQDLDVKKLLAWNGLPINLEMAMSKEIILKALRWKPFSVTLVPERRAEMTTESGLDLNKLKTKKREIRSLSKASRVYAFIDPDLTQVKLARDLDFKGIEFHTGHFAYLFEKQSKGLSREIDRLFKSAELAHEMGLDVKAGHGLTLDNIRLLVSMPYLDEVNIGHSIVCESVFNGLEVAVRMMKRALL